MAATIGALNICLILTQMPKENQATTFTDVAARIQVSGQGQQMLTVEW
jgi:hypothetical protein